MISATILPPSLVATRKTAFSSEAGGIAASDHPILDPISLRKNQGVFIVARTQTLLIVDDDADYLRLAGRFLERLGYNWLTAGNGEQAVDVYRRCRPDAVLMDIVMPVKNGIEAVVIILEEDPQARVIFVSATGSTR